MRKVLNDCDMVITVAAGRDEDGKELTDTHKFSKIKVSAADEKILEVGNAIIEVINHSGGDAIIDKVENYGLIA